MSEQSLLAKDRLAQAALSVQVNGKWLQQPMLHELVWHLHKHNQIRIKQKGKPFSDDHLKQEAVKWAKQRISNE